MRQGQLVDLAVVLEAFAGADRADDLDRLASAANRSVEADAVPTLHHLRTAGTDAEHEPTARQRLQRKRGHREHRRRARAELHDASGKPHSGSARSEVSE